MKLILDLDEKTVATIQGYCTAKGTNPSDLVKNLFNQYIQEPAELLDKVYYDNKIKDFEDFQKTLRYYLNEAILDIEESAQSEEAYETDEIMAKVFKGLARDLLDNAYLLTSLYKIYEEEVTK